MTEESEQCQVHALFSITTVCPQNLPVCVVWILEAFFIYMSFSWHSVIFAAKLNLSTSNGWEALKSNGEIYKTMLFLENDTNHSRWRYFMHQ